MVFFISMFFCNLLIPLVMLIAGWLMYKNPPKNINHFIGYRTRRSKKSPETWAYAHDKCGRLWVKGGAILTLLSILAQLPFAKKEEAVIGKMTLFLELFQVIFMLGSLYFVEKGLKENFDDQGKKINKGEV